jgi:peptide/nickel transport system substrate-binding protein
VKRALGLVAVAAAVLLAGCGNGGGGAVATKPLGSIDINPAPRDKIRDGGDLRLPMQSFPSNFNYNQLDGASGDLNHIDLAVLPEMFVGTADGGDTLNTDYLTSATVTSTSPQVITYTINPKATWSDGTPITYRDFQAYWHALNGRDPAYQPAGTSGYTDISSVARGSDDKQAVVTFSKPFGEWHALFGPLTPASLNSTPSAFNTSWQASLPITAGPFTVRSVDQTNNTVTLARDPRWWGTPAKLDHIIFRAYTNAAEPDALANNELDYYDIGSDLDMLRRAQHTEGAVLRDAPGRQYTHVTFNGATGSPLADPRLRQAVAAGINRQEITRRLIGQIVPNAQPDGNHLYAPGSKQYQDHSGLLPYDPAKARQILDSLGWVHHGTSPDAVRAKDGKPLSLRLVYSIFPTNQNTAVTVQNELAQIGVEVVLDAVDPNQFFPTYVDTGNFDMALFVWESTPYPFSSSTGVYQQPLGNNVLENYGRVGSPQIDALLSQGNAELDDTKRAVIGNQLDQLLWQEAHSVVIYARPGAVAVRANLANFGAWGFADWNFINAGFLK